MTNTTKDSAEIGLIFPDNLPNSVRESLSNEQILELGLWLFEQIVNQRDYTREHEVKQ